MRTPSHLLFASLLLSGCQERPACQPAELARIEAAFVQEAVTTCAGQTIETCPQYPAIKAKYSAQRDAWVSCR